jgi:2-oxoglutarate ferredoxin oxidoreductase subunit beta
MSRRDHPETLTRKDFATDQDVRWCPGCGDYSILANVQRVMRSSESRAKDRVGERNRLFEPLSYYMNTYGFHTIHGRSPAVAMGIKAANPELSGGSPLATATA